MNINNKFLKYKQKYLNFKEQIGIINQYGGNKRCLSICNHNNTGDIQYILEYLNISLEDIENIPIANLTLDYISKSSKYRCVVFQRCDNIDINIIKNIHFLLEEDGILYIDSLNNEHLKEFKKNITGPFNTFYIPSTIINKTKLPELDARSLSYLLNNYFKHNKEYEKLKSIGAVLPVIKFGSYFEKQIGGDGCGRHALNNLFGVELFEKPNFSDRRPYSMEEIYVIGNTVEKRKMNLDKLCQLYQQFNTRIEIEKGKGKKIDTHLCDKKENYHSNVIMTALQICGYECHHITINAFKILDEYDELSDYIGFIINYPGHWVSLRKIPRGYIYYDSLIHGSQTFNTIRDFCTQYSKKFIHILTVFKRSNQIESLSNIHEVKDYDIERVQELAMYKMKLRSILKDKSNDKISEKAIDNILQIADIDNLIFFIHKIEHIKLSDELIKDINDVYTNYSRDHTSPVKKLNDFISKIPSEVDDTSIEIDRTELFRLKKEELNRILNENNIDQLVINFIMSNIEDYEIAKKFIDKIRYHDTKLFNISTINLLLPLPSGKSPSKHLRDFIDNIQLLSPVSILDI